MSRERKTEKRGAVRWSAWLGGRGMLIGCCGVVMCLLAFAELWVCGVPDGFWRFFGWGMLIGTPITVALFFVYELGDLCKKAAECCKARQAIGKQGGSIRTVNGFLQQLRVLLLGLRNLIYHVLKIHSADRHVVVSVCGQNQPGVCG